MILDLLKLLQSAAVGMMDGSVLGPKQGYEQASSAILGITLNTLAESFDGAAEGYCEENAALRQILRDGVPLAGEAELAEKLERAAGESDANLRLTTLREANERLRALLIDLHAEVEEREGEAARAFEARIWSELVRSTERRRVALGPF